MAHTFYSEYAAHAMRFYARNQHLSGSMEFQTEAEMLNWNTCLKTLLQFGESEKEILLEIYRERDTFPDNVYQASRKRGIPQNEVWTLNNNFLTAFAKNRGLL